MSHNREELQNIMWDYVGIVRSDMRLKRALNRQTLLYNEVEEFYHRTIVTPELLELRNLILYFIFDYSGSYEKKGELWPSL